MKKYYKERIAVLESQNKIFGENEERKTKLEVFKEKLNNEVIKELQKIEYNTLNNWCAVCGEDTPINEFKKHKCKNCGKEILPCALCDMDCCDCPF